MSHQCWIEPVVLENGLARLIPLEPAHERALTEAATDGRLWEAWYTSVPEPGEMRAAIEQRLEQQRFGSTLPFTIVEKFGNRIVGQTNFLNVDSENRRVEIGGTWLSHSAQRTGINTACKLLLLSHAFEKLECIAVEFRTSWFNVQSRRAIERLGAKLDGVLRHHSRHRNGTIRDTVVYSIIAPEWPSVRSNLSARIAQRARDER